MRRFAAAVLMSLMAEGVSFAKTHNEMYSVSCAVLWPAVKDTLRNSGEYSVLWMDNGEMTAAFAIGAGQGLRIPSVVLNAKGETCEMQLQTPYGVLFTDDSGDFKKRVDASLAKLQRLQPASAKPGGPGK